MKASAAVVAVVASASAQTLTFPFSFIDRPISAGPLSVPNAATPVFRQTSNTNLTSTPTSAASSLAPRPLEWVTRIRKDASASDLEPAAAAAAAAAAAKQMTAPTLTGDASVVPTVKIRGDEDIEEGLRLPFGGSANLDVDPAATLRIAEHQDVLRTMTKTTRTKQTHPMASSKHALNAKDAGTPPKTTTTATTQGEQPRVTPNPAGTMRGEDILEILSAESKKQQQ